jgi:hypothetical protein
LQTIVDSITSTLEYMTDVQKGTKDFISLTFEPQGCLWTLEFNPNLKAKAYQLHVVCRACADIEGHNAYAVDSMVVAVNNYQEKYSPSDPVFKEAKEAFEFAALQIRKAIVKLEFPDFPEGCKGRPFRDVYQLNAKVSFCLGIKTCMPGIMRTDHGSHTRLFVSPFFAAQVGFLRHRMSRNTPRQWQKGGHQVCLAQGLASLGRCCHLR